MVLIMDNEQTELLDELMTQLSQAQAELAFSSNMQQYNEARNIVKNHVIAGMSMGLVPFALFDIAALSTNLQTMLQHLCRHYDVEYEGRRGRLLTVSLIGGSLSVLTLMGLSSVSKLVPGVGTLGGNAGVALLGGAVTYATGQTFIRHFTAGGTLDDFMPERFSGFFKKELQKGKNIAGKLKPQAVADSIAGRG